MGVIGISEEINENMNEEGERSQKISELEAKIAELEGQLRALSGAYGEEYDEGDYEDGECRVEEERRLLKKLRSGLLKLHEVLAPLAEKYRNRRGEVAEKAAEKICEHPIAAVAAAFGIGFVAAKLLENKICRSERFYR